MAQAGQTPIAGHRRLQAIHQMHISYMKCQPSPLALLYPQGAYGAIPLQLKLLMASHAFRQPVDLNFIFTEGKPGEPSFFPNLSAQFKGGDFQLI